MDRAGDFSQPSFDLASGGHHRGPSNSYLDGVIECHRGQEFQTPCVALPPHPLSSMWAFTGEIRVVKEDDFICARSNFGP